MAQEFALFGGGGHAKVVLDAMRACWPGASIVILDDDPDAIHRPVLDREIVGSRDMLRSLPHVRVVPAIGRNDLRFALIDWLHEFGRSMERVLHPAAIVGCGVEVGAGSFVAAGAVINADTKIGEGVIVNTSASVDHDCEIGPCVHIAPGARLCGSVSVGPRTLVGTGAIILPGIKIGSDVVIGAGSVVRKDLRDGSRVAGVPARPL